MKPRFLLLIAASLLLFVPFAAFSVNFDEYGYNEKANLFVGTLENWDAMLYGMPPLPVPDADATDVMFIEREWNKSFDDMMFHGAVPVEGSYCATHAHMNLSGDMLGWTWHEFFAFTFSYQQIAGAVEVPGMPGFYFITDRVWLTGPDGNDTIVSEINATFDGKYKGKINTLKSLTKKNFTFKGSNKGGVKPKKNK